MAEDEKIERPMFINFGNVGAFGKDPIAHNFSINEQAIRELRTLADHLSEIGEKETSLAILDAADAGEEEKNIKTIEHLKRAGKWAAEKAEKLGLVAAETAIKAAIQG